MNKIEFLANKDTNYVFHMLSVAKCGYNNAYGDYYRNLYEEKDLLLLKTYEKLIIVSGGEYCGELYGTLVAGAAGSKVSAKDYYKNLIYVSEANLVPEGFEEYVEIVCEISKVMIKYYDQYIDTIWNQEKQKIIEYIPKVVKLFEESNFTDKAEKIVGCKLPTAFKATLVTSVENGAEAIDISDEQDVFGINRDPLHAFYFIGHEFVIYLIVNALKNENITKNITMWPIIESLAEFYLKQIIGTGNTHLFAEQQKLAEYFEECCHFEQLTVTELYKKGLEKIKMKNR